MVLWNLGKEPVSTDQPEGSDIRHNPHTGFLRHDVCGYFQTVFQRGHHFPRIITTLEKGPVEGADLPTPLNSVECTVLSDPAVWTKMVAWVHTPPKEPALEYRLDACGSFHIGRWFESGPGKGL